MKTVLSPLLLTFWDAEEMASGRTKLSGAEKRRTSIWQTLQPMHSRSAQERGKAPGRLDRRGCRWYLSQCWSLVASHPFRAPAVCPDLCKALGIRSEHESLPGGSQQF